MEYKTAPHGKAFQLNAQGEFFLPMGGNHQLMVQIFPTGSHRIWVLGPGGQHYSNSRGGHPFTIFEGHCRTVTDRVVNAVDSNPNICPEDILGILKVWYDQAF